MIIKIFKKSKCFGPICIISFLKATIWRIIATGITFSIMMIYGLEYNKSILFAIFDTIVKFLIFYLFDMLWTVIHNIIKKRIKINKTSEDPEVIEDSNII